MILFGGGGGGGGGKNTGNEILTVFQNAMDRGIPISQMRRNDQYRGRGITYSFLISTSFNFYDHFFRNTC